MTLKSQQPNKEGLTYANARRKDLGHFSTSHLLYIRRNERYSAHLGYVAPLGHSLALRWLK